MDELARRRAWEAVRSLCFLPPPSDLPEGHAVESAEEVGNTWPSSRWSLSSVAATLDSLGLQVLSQLLQSED